MSYPPSQNGGNMNETNTRNRQSRLEQLSPELQEKIIDMAANARLIDIIDGLREHGVETSVRSLKRYIRAHREKNLMEDSEDSTGAVERLATRAQEGKLRAGTLEAVRQQLYTQALEANSPEQALQLYAAMVKEETRLKELEIEARKVAALEQQVKLQGLRIEVQARQVKGRKTAEVLESTAAPVAVAELTEGEGAGVKEDVKSEAERKRLERVLREIHAIANSGGYPEEKVQELRARLAEEVKKL
jgi:hypothetical protein